MPGFAWHVDPNNVLTTITGVISFDYTPRGSVVESFDPRAQVIFYLAFTTSVLLITNPLVLGGMIAVAAGIALLARLTWRETRQAWIALVVIVAIFTVLNLITGRGVEYAFVNALKLFATFLATSVAVRAINPRDYGVLWRGLGAPDKLAFTMNLMMRYVPTLSRDFAQTMDAQRARGLELDKPKGGFAERVRRFAPLVIPVIVRSVVDSTDVADAMEMRSFGAVRRRSWIRALRYRARDLVLIVLGVIGLALAAALSLGWIALPAA